MWLSASSYQFLMRVPPPFPVCINQPKSIGFVSWGVSLRVTSEPTRHKISEQLSSTRNEFGRSNSHYAKNHLRKMLASPTRLFIISIKVKNNSRNWIEKGSWRLFVSRFGILRPVTRLCSVRNRSCSCIMRENQTPQIKSVVEYFVCK